MERERYRYPCPGGQNRYLRSDYDCTAPITTDKRTEEPVTFDFGDWSAFCSRALRYHEATRPNDQLLSDRIGTLRRYMSERVVKYLNGFVRQHPRFDTNAGWDEWQEGVAEALAIHNIIPFANAPVNPSNADDLTASYERGKLVVARYWQGLDELVSSSVLTSAEQRQLFWNALKEADRARVLHFSAAFDPSDVAWQADDEQLKEQRLAQIMEFLFLDDYSKFVRNGSKALYWALNVSILVLFCFAVYYVFSEGGLFFWALLIISPLLAVYHNWAGLKFRARLNSLRPERRLRELSFN